MIVLELICVLEHLVDEYGGEADDIPYKRSGKVMLSNFERALLQKAVLVEAGLEIDEDIADEDNDGGSVEKFEHFFIVIERMVLFVDQSVPKARMMGIWMK